LAQVSTGRACIDCDETQLVLENIVVLEIVTSHGEEVMGDSGINLAGL
jgi:hypothetical protein